VALQHSVIDVAGYQPAKIVRVFSGAAATALVQQKSDPVHIFENSVDA